MPNKGEFSPGVVLEQTSAWTLGVKSETSPQEKGIGLALGHKIYSRLIHLSLGTGVGGQGLCLIAPGILGTRLRTGQGKGTQAVFGGSR